MNKRSEYLRKPEWLKTHLPGGKVYATVDTAISQRHLHTICTSGHCPNQADCWSRGTATFMILGDICTRSCKFCNVQTGRPLPPDWSEPFKIAQAIRELKLKHCVLTSVDRDDLPDGGAEVWSETIRQVKTMNPGVTIEGLIPDFDGKTEHIHKIADTHPDVLSHNLETVRRLTSEIRSRAKYETSLKVIDYIAHRGITAKSGIMLGLGETSEEVLQTMDDLRIAGCKVLTIGQYLQPTRKHYPVKEYVTPEKFREYEIMGLEKGFTHVESGPLVRSSFRAEKHVPVRHNITQFPTLGNTTK